jgi:hypothetical protein
MTTLKRRCNDIGWVRGVEASVHSEERVREAERIEFTRSSGSLADCASVGAGDQDNGGPLGIFYKSEITPLSNSNHFRDGSGYHQ